MMTSCDRARLLLLDAIDAYRRSGWSAIRRCWLDLSEADRGLMHSHGNATMRDCGLQKRDRPEDRFDRLVIACADGMPPIRPAPARRGRPPARGGRDLMFAAIEVYRTRGVAALRPFHEGLSLSDRSKLGNIGTATMAGSGLHRIHQPTEQRFEVFIRACADGIPPSKPRRGRPRKSATL